MNDALDYKSFDDLPLNIDVKTLASILGICLSNAYELVHEEGFPSVRIGGRIIVKREDFIRWVNENVSR